MEALNFKELLHNRGLKATSSRLSLLNKMQAYGSAIPYSAIQKEMNSLDRVTLYRTIESLSRQGIIHKAHQENSEVYYAICGETCDTEHHHHDHIHFKCQSCDAVTCEKPGKAIRVSIPDYEIHKVSIHLTGVCKKCKGKSIPHQN